MRVDLHVLNDTGNITDCCVLACLLALKHFKLVYNVLLLPAMDSISSS